MQNEKPFDIYERSFNFSCDLIEFIRNTSYEKIYFPIFSQLLRAGASIGANLVEGIAGSSKKDWINFFLISLKSANESKYWLRLINQTILCDKKQVNLLIIEVEEISKIIGAIISKAKKL